MRVGIIGMGAMGQGHKRWLDEHSCVHVTYDPKYDDEYPGGKILECDFLVMCVPTQCVDAAMEEIPLARPTLLRSTVVPGTTEKYPNAVYCPEFTQEPSRGNWRDPDDVPFLILGGPGDLTAKFRRWLGKLYKTGAIVRCSSRVAELAKYTDNLFLATKVTFANEMARICSAWGVDWRDVEPLWRIDPRTGYTHTRVTEEGGFGEGFSRDLAAMIEAASMGDYNADFLMAIEEANARFRQ